MRGEFFSLIFFGIVSYIQGSPPVYVSNGTHIVSYTKDGSVVRAILGQRDYRIVGLAADVTKNILFWSDISAENRGIYRSDLQGNNITRLLRDVGEVNGLTVDWVSQHIYWTDVMRKTIEVSNYDCQARRIIVSTELKTPNSIVAAPIFGYLFWADQRGKRIERASLDGSSRRTVVKSAKYFPNQLAVSIENKKLYWVDSWENSIFSCKLNGKKCRLEVNFANVTKGAPGFGLLVFGNTAVISTWFNTAIYSMLLNPKKLIWLVEKENLGTRELFNLVSLSPSTQPMTIHPCMDADNGGCSHLCLPTRKEEYVCTCPTYGGLALSSDGKTCAVPDDILLLSLEYTRDIGFVALDPNWSREVHLISKSTSPGTLTYDRRGRMVYWSDKSDGAIYRSRIEGMERSIFLNGTNGIGRVDGLAFNSVTGCLYYTNAVLLQSRDDVIPHSIHTVEMIDVHTDDRKVILKTRSKPVKIVVDEVGKYLYVALSVHQPRIVRTDLDGTNKIELRVDVTNPVGIAVDIGVLSVVDRRDVDIPVIAVLDYNLETATVTEIEITNTTVVGFSKRENELFVAKEENNQLLKINDTIQQTLLSDRKIAGLCYTKTSRKTEDHISKCIEFGCSHSCIPLPDEEPERYRCTCPAQNSLFLPVDGKMCKQPKNFMIYSNINKINMLSLDEDLSTEPITIYFGSTKVTIASLSYDATKERMYWIDRGSNSIYLSHLHQFEPILVYKQDNPMTDMQFDSRRQKLYWSSKHLNSSDNFITSISMKRGLSSKTTLMTYYRSIKSLSLHPKGRWLYWIEAQNEFYPFAGIGSCKAKPPVKFEDVMSDEIDAPTAMHVSADKLYIAEKGGKLLVTTLEGVVTEAIYTDSKHVSSLLVYKNMFVVADIKDKAIKIADIYTGATSTLVHDLDHPTTLTLHHPDDVNESCKNSKCLDRCIPLFRGEYKCECSDGRVMQKDGVTCTEEFITDEPEIKFLSTTTPLVTTTSSTNEIKDNEYYEDLKKTENTSTSQDPFEESSETTENEIDDPPTTSVDNLIAVGSSEYPQSSIIVDGHTGEPKPTMSTKKESHMVSTEKETVFIDRVDEINDHLEHYDMVTKPFVDVRFERLEGYNYNEYGTDDLTYMEPVYAPTLSNDMPRFENCPPSGETIIVHVPETDSSVELQIKPTGYESNGAPLPLHSNYELTSDGIIIPWEGIEPASHHNVTFKVTDSHKQTAICSFPVQLQDVDQPIFTYCPQSIKVRTSNHSAYVNWTVPEAVDNVGLKVLKSSHSPGTHFTSGESKINYTAVDFAGNKASCLFSVFILHDAMCNLPDIKNGGIICNNGRTEECNVICENGFVVNPVRTFRRSFNCNHPDDVDALKKAMATQETCLSHRYPSILSQEFSLLFNGPISRHKLKVKADMNTAISMHLIEEDLCIGEVCQVGNVTLHCDRDLYISDVENDTCLDETERHEFFIKFNVTLTNSSGVDVETVVKNIHLELMSLAALLRLQTEGDMFVAIADSLKKTRSIWTCPMGQIQEHNICVLCPQGTFHNMTLNVCQYCTMGYYQDQKGAVTCRMCDIGQSSPDGATSNDQCHTVPSMDEMTLFIIVTTCSFGVVFLCMAITLYLQFQRQQKRNQMVSNQKKTRYNMSPNIYVAPPPILKSKLDENYSTGQKTYSIDRKKPINIYANHDYEDPERSSVTGPVSSYQSDLFTMLQGHSRDYSPGDEVPTGTLSRENTFSNPTYSPTIGLRRNERGSLTRGVNTPSPGPQRKMSHDSTFSNQSPRMIRSQRTPTSDTPLITQSPLLRLKLAAYNLNQED